ncbi:hypothetical protein BaRGS_00024970, partial [Batillaria attramentaria]
MSEAESVPVADDAAVLSFATEKCALIDMPAPGSRLFFFALLLAFFKSSVFLSRGISQLEERSWLVSVDSAALRFDPDMACVLVLTPHVGQPFLSFLVLFQPHFSVGGRAGTSAST